ncbi:fimbria/pilus outer membrane usher protein [Serratia fonticola]|uniref:fimbria/pilus outer membrane usher protein n=1 Tax=Serratia fonticola TaxID=47917 RepID=UPI000E0FE453|nr:fimbria/pilus outer membrane usher protein [Serratia fonticola]RDL27149.1 outer membrane usher protein FimD/PapC [Serratia fonticola]
MTSLVTRKKISTIVILSLLYGPQVYAEIQFNAGALDVDDSTKIDLSRFSDADYIMPGRYLLDIKFNKRMLPQRSIQYLHIAGKKESVLCLPPDLIPQMALKEEIAKKVVLWHDNQCADISAVSGAEISSRIGSGVLLITVPQSSLKYNDPNWTPPEQWDKGIPGLLLDYSVSGQINKANQSQDTTRNLSTVGTVGANVSSWRLRADFQSTVNQREGERDSNFDWSNIYAYLPLPTHAAKLKVGEQFLDSNIFDSFRFAGANLASDERMLPPDLQGYAPQVRGIAKSSAKVTVSQGGTVLFQTTVPAGPFSIDSLSSGVRGRLDVTVEEQDGSVSTFQVDTATIPYLTRPGYVRYNIATGKPSVFGRRLEGPFFTTSDFSWGIANAWSLYGGALIGGEYNAWSLGLGRDLSILGALSVDITQSYAKLPDETNSGMSFRVNYAKRFEEYDSQITFAGYRFSQRNFMTMNQFLQKSNNNTSNELEQYIGREKEQYIIAASKTFMAQDRDKAITVYLNYSHQTYWDSRAQDRYGFSASKIFNIGNIRNVTASVSAFRTEYNGQNDDSISLNFTMPIGDRRSLGYSLQTNNSDVTNVASYNDYTDPNNTWQVSGGVNQNDKVLTRGFYTHNASFGTVNASASYQQDSFSSIGGTFRSGITATQHGVAAHSNYGNGSTRLMVDTDGVSGVPINNGRTRSNRFGVAVISDLTSYSNTETRINVNKLADDVEATTPVVQGTLTEGAIGYRHFEVVQGTKLMAIIKLADGSTPPFGATVLNSKGREMAMVGDAGLAYLTGVGPEESLDIAWDGKYQCKVVVPKAAKSLEQILLPCKL